MLRGPSGEVRDGSRTYSDFSSNDYLGLSWDSEIISWAASYAKIYGAGSGGSRLLCGHADYMDEVERAVAAFKGTESSLIFPCGYMANMGVLAALTSRDTVVLADRFVHRSIIEGARSGRLYRYPHGDLGVLEVMLQRNRDKEMIVVTEALFGMDGDRADVEGLLDLKERFGFVLYIDEAHLVGTCGSRGSGIQSLGIDLIMGTFSKALGCFGAYVACSSDIKARLIDRAPAFIYTTAPPPAQWGAMRAALQQVERAEPKRQKLRANSRQMRRLLEKSDWSVPSGSDHIFPLIVGGADEARALARKWQEAGVLVFPICPPTVPENTARLRLAVSSSLGDADFQRVEALL